MKTRLQVVFGLLVVFAMLLSACAAPAAAPSAGGGEAAPAAGDSGAAPAASGENITFKQTPYALEM